MKLEIAVVGGGVCVCVLPREVSDKLERLWSKDGSIPRSDGGQNGHTPNFCGFHAGWSVSELG